MSDVILKNIMFLSVQVKRFKLSPAVLSVIAAEMYFRGPLYRLMEYCAWIALWRTGAKRVETLSVGIAQIQLKRWLELGYINSYSPNISHLITVSSLDNNYTACHSYLSQIAFPDQAKPKELSKLYSGRARTFHVKVIECAFDIATKISITKASSRRGRA